MEILLPVAAVAMLVIFIGYLRREQTTISCPECESVRVRQVDQQLKHLKQDAKMGYGVKLDVQLILETRYACQSCHHRWTVTAPEQ